MKKTRRRAKPRLRNPFLLFLLLFLLSSFGEFFSTAKAEGEREGEQKKLVDLLPSSIFSRFSERVKKNPRFKLIVSVYAPWCGHCKVLEPELVSALKIVREVDGTDETVVDVVKMNGDLRKYPIREEMEQRETEARKAFKKKYGVKGYPTLLLLEKKSDDESSRSGRSRSEEEEEEEEELFVAKQYKGSRSQAALLNYLRRASASDVATFKDWREAREYGKLRATESNAMFFHLMVNGGSLKIKKAFDSEAKKRENLQAWFGESDAPKTFEETNAFLDAFHAKQFPWKDIQSKDESYSVLLAVHPRVPGDEDDDSLVSDGENYKAFTTEVVLCRVAEEKEEEEEEKKKKKKKSYRANDADMSETSGYENPCNVSAFVRTRIVAPLAKLDQSVFNNILDLDSPSVFLVESGGDAKIEAFAKNAYKLALKHRKISFVRVDGDELGPWLDKEMAFGPLESSFPLCLGYHKKTHRSWYDRKWETRGNTIEESLAVFVDMNFVDIKRLPNFLPSMPLLGKLKNIHHRATFRFSNSSSPVQRLATYWWLLVIALILFVLCFSFALQYQREGKFDTSSEDDSSAKSSGEDERAAKVEESDGDEPKKTK
jgi:thiol-disulfide isomerase/thioredoxin